MKEEKVVVAISQKGYIKRGAEHEFEQKKALFKSPDFVVKTFSSANSRFMLFFSKTGTCYPLRTSFVPSASASDEGSAITRLLNLPPDHLVSAMEIEKFDSTGKIFLVTRQGLVKKIDLSEFNKRREEGLTAIALKGDDELVSAFLTEGSQEVVMASAFGKAIRFSEQDVREMGLGAGGIKGMTLDEGDAVIASIPLQNSKKTTSLLSVTDQGMGKRSDLSAYSQIKRGGKGIVNYKVTEKTGPVAGILQVEDKSKLYLITKKGRLKRVRAKDVKIMGRASQGFAQTAWTVESVLTSARPLPGLRAGRAL